MRIAVGADHGGFRLKDDLAARLRAAGHEVIDLGTNSEASVDYPDFAVAVARQVAEGQADRGVLVCGTGQGMSMAANKVPGVRAAVVSDAYSARMATEHNDARVICFGERVIGNELAWSCLTTWLGATFAGGRHERRVAKIERGG